MEKEQAEGNVPTSKKSNSCLSAGVIILLFCIFLAIVSTLSNNTEVKTTTSSVKATLPTKSADPTNTSSQSENTSQTPDPLSEPEKMLHRYYDLINKDNFQDAYKLRSSASRNKTDINTFKKTWENNKTVSVDKSKTIDQSTNTAVVEIKLLSVDFDPANNDIPAKATFYNGKVDLLLEDGEWHYNGGDFSPEEVGKEDEQAGQWNIVGLIGNQVPGYVGSGTSTNEFTLSSGEKVWITAYNTTTKIINLHENETIQGQTAKVKCYKKRTILNPGEERGASRSSQYEFPSHVIRYEADEIEITNSDGSSRSPSQAQKERVPVKETTPEPSPSEFVVRTIEKESWKSPAADLFVISKKAVKDKLVSPSSAKFPRMSNEEVIFQEVEKNIFVVNGYVEANNRFNAFIKSNYSVRIEYYDLGWKGSKYRVLDVNID